MPTDVTTLVVSCVTLVTMPTSLAFPEAIARWSWS